jgi:hypothetical protein
MYCPMSCFLEHNGENSLTSLMTVAVSGSRYHGNHLFTFHSAQRILQLLTDINTGTHNPWVHNTRVHVSEQQNPCPQHPYT